MNKLEQIALTKIKGVGPKTSRLLLAYCGSAEQIFKTSKKQLRAIPGIGEITANQISSKAYLAEAEKELDFIEKHTIQLLWIEDNAFPKRLKNCEDSPLVLYYKGNTSLNPERVISVVGTRNATAYGKKICNQLIEDLQSFNVQVISGLAYGIDIQAHKASLKNGLSTVAVLAHGLDRIYPSSHRETALKMIDEGGLLTEYPSETIPDKTNFPARNRIIAGLSDVVVVVEAASRGGALITAEIANSYNRDVCSFPGGIDQEYSAGCNYLIKTNRAHLIRNADDLCYLMNWSSEQKSPASKQLSLLPPTLSKDETVVYNYLAANEHATIDEIALFCDWPQSKLAIILLELEMNNIILSLPGKVYKLI